MFDWNTIGQRNKASPNINERKRGVCFKNMLGGQDWPLECLCYYTLYINNTMTSNILTKKTVLLTPMLSSFLWAVLYVAFGKRDTRTSIALFFLRLLGSRSNISNSLSSKSAIVKVPAIKATSVFSPALFGGESSTLRFSGKGGSLDLDWRMIRVIFLTKDKKLINKGVTYYS